MMRWLSVVFPSFLLIGTLFNAGCGNNRQLQSVTVNPASADAKDFSGGKVQFTATGNFGGSSIKVPLSSPQIVWCTGTTTSVGGSPVGQCAGSIAQFAFVDQNGVAQCSGPGPTRTTYILAGTASEVAPGPDQGQQLNVFGSGQLTCP